MSSNPSWPPPGPPQDLPGAHLSGWAAYAVDCILRRNADPYARAMSTEQRMEFEAAGRAIHAAALLWHQHAITAERNAEMVAAEIEESSTHEIGTAAAATLLGVTERRVCQLAPAWQDDGLARKVGRAWLIDRGAVLLEARSRQSAA